MIHMLADEIGPRRPAPTPRRTPANRLAAWLRERGVDARIEEFRGYSTFAPPYARCSPASLAGGLLQRSPSPRLRRAGDVLALSSRG